MIFYPLKDFQFREILSDLGVRLKFYFIKSQIIEYCVLQTQSISDWSPVIWSFFNLYRSQKRSVEIQSVA